MWFRMLMLACLLSCESQRPLLRDAHEAQMEATSLLGEVALCSGVSGKERETDDGFSCNRNYVATGGFTCWADRQKFAICPADKKYPCSRVWKKPAETEVAP